MRWLLYGTGVTPAVAEALKRHEQTVQTVEEAGIAADASAFDVYAAARAKQLEIFTTDPKLAAAPYEQEIPFKRVVVFLQLEGADVEQDDAVDRLFGRYRRMTPGRLYTVTGSRVKVRQLPGQL
jgi:uncharacterized protein (DUF1501 family)